MQKLRQTSTEVEQFLEQQFWIYAYSFLKRIRKYIYRKICIQLQYKILKAFLILRFHISRQKEAKTVHTPENQLVDLGLYLL